MHAGALKDRQAQAGALGAALEREHRDIDADIEAFRAGSAGHQAPMLASAMS